MHFTPFGVPARGIPAPGVGASSGQTIQSPEVLIQGTVANLHQVSSRGRWRVGVRIHSNDTSRPLIGQLIAQRQAEIIREIKTLYEMLVQS